MRMLTHVAYEQEVKQLGTTDDPVFSAYSQTVSHAKDARSLARVGEKLLVKGMPRFAVLHFKRASELDPNYRDAAYGWAYALLQEKKESLTEADLQEIHTAINRAEAIDPLYIPVLKLKLFLAELEQDQSVINATQARLQLLEANS